MTSDKLSRIYGDNRIEECGRCICNRCKRPEKTSFCKTHCDMCIVVEGNGKRDKCLYAVKGE